MAEDDLDIQYNRAHISVRWNTILFPFDAISLTRSLARHGYVLPESLTNWSHIRRNVDVEGGIVARKGPIAVQLNVDRNFIAVAGADPESIASEFNLIEELIEDDLEFDSRSKATFYEFLANARIRSEGNPLLSLQRPFGDMPILRRASSIVGFDATLYGMRLIEKGTAPTDVNWTDIRLEPQVQASEHFYTTDTTFRRGSREPVLEFARGLERMFQALTAAVESGGIE